MPYFLNMSVNLSCISSFMRVSNSRLQFKQRNLEVCTFPTLIHIFHVASEFLYIVHEFLRASPTFGVTLFK